MLLAGAAGTPWRDAARAVAGRLGAPLDAFTVGPDGDLRDPEDRWPAAYGLEPDGAVLMRPDGHVGWRGQSAAADPRARLEGVLRRILGREDQPPETR